MSCLFHKWDGCKCSKCGKVRDKQHNWNGCICVQCEKTRDEQHDWDGNVCKLCGKNKSLINKIQEFGEKHLPFLHLNKRENVMLLGLGISLAFMFVFIGIMAVTETNSNKNNKMNAPTHPSVSENVNSLGVTDELHEGTLSPSSQPMETPKPQEQVELPLTPEPTEKQVSQTPIPEIPEKKDNSSDATKPRQSHTPTPATLPTPTSTPTPAATETPRQGHYTVKYGPRGGAICWCGRYMSQH